MYRVKNITNGKILLGDLDNLIILKGEEIDLDEQFSRDVIDASKDLVKATDPKRRVLAVLHKDVPVQVPVAVHVPTPVPHPTTQPALTPADIEAMVRQTLSKMGVADNSGTQQKLDMILAALAQGVAARPAAEPQAETSVGEVDNDRAVDIQARLIKRLSNNVEAQVEAKTETKESDVGKNAADLSNLLGEL